MIDLINLTKILGSPEKVQSVLSEISKSSGNGESFEKILQKVVDELSKTDTSESPQNENSAVAKKIALSQQIVKNENQVGSLGEENKMNKKEILQTTVTGQSERLIKETTAGDSKTHEVKSDNGEELFSQASNELSEGKDINNDKHISVIGKLQELSKKDSNIISNSLQTSASENGKSETGTAYLKEEKIIEATKEEDSVSQLKKKFLTEFTSEAPKDDKHGIVVADTGVKGQNMYTKYETAEKLSIKANTVHTEQQAQVSAKEVTLNMDDAGKENSGPVSSNSSKDNKQTKVVMNASENVQPKYVNENRTVSDNAGIFNYEAPTKTKRDDLQNVQIFSQQLSETKTSNSKTAQSLGNKIAEPQSNQIARIFSQKAEVEIVQDIGHEASKTRYVVEPNSQMAKSKTTDKKTDVIQENLQKEELQNNVYRPSDKGIQNLAQNAFEAKRIVESNSAIAQSKASDTKTNVINEKREKLEASTKENKSIGRVSSFISIENIAYLEERAQLLQSSVNEFSKSLQRQNSTNGVVSNVNVEKTNVLHEINVRNARTSENVAVVNGLSTSHTNVQNKSNMEKIDKVISQEKIQTSQRVVPFVANSNANESKQNDAERKSDGNILPILGSIRLIASEKLNQIVNFQSKDEDIGKDNAIDSKASKISNQQISLAAELVKSAAMENPKVVSNQPNVQVNESIKDKNNVQLAEKSNIPDITQPEISSDVVKPAQNDIFQNTNSQQEKYDAKAFRNEAGEVSKNKLEIKSFEVEYRVKDEPKKGEIQEKPNISNKFLERLAEMTYKASETKFEQTYQASSRFELAERLQYARNLEEIYQKIREFGFSGKLEENVRMKLYPEQLGNIDVELKKEGRSITIVFVAENEKSKELLEKNIGVLRERLTTLDFDVKNLEVRMKEENNYYEESRHQHNQQQREHNQEGNRKRAFNEEVMEDDDERERDV
ncbi:flagellar hook-length control protein FliK [Fervidobacterium islandicum]|uniref:Flagellar hook-length control protein FliK n=1 Tax=Fervidobacterium islandicum TaxID=2423 RepID=A0AAI8CK58_FERIS|nr:flagellar hook-length control protein FliK [Fervidobacterium islandicum]AMW31912.1 flagellar hook-length control protein FliK [Fervidobacterium islandicum]